MKSTRKSLKRSLLVSAAALVLSIAMLIGTTFAWFTDSVTSGVNKIVAGNLDVDIVDATGNSLAGKALDWVVNDSRTQADILWEPNATYQLTPFRIVNKGNLAVKYKVTINGVDGNAKLLEAIDFSAKSTNDTTSTDLTLTNGSFEGNLLPKDATPTTNNEPVEKTDLITISGHMKKEAGNEYQGLSIDGISITVVATQYTYESDSFNNQYDETAEAEIQVNKENIQDYLDGKYGSIDGMTLVLAGGDYDNLELGRATKYAGSNTRYFTMANGSTTPEKEYSYDDFIALKNDTTTWTPSPKYIRSMSNVTFKAAEGATVNITGIDMQSGHKYGTNDTPAYDYVLDRKITDNGGYFLAHRVNGLKFEGLHFTNMVNIYSSQPETSIYGVTFHQCTFDINDASIQSSKKGLQYVAEQVEGTDTVHGSVGALTVDDCTFNTCYQGVYTRNTRDTVVTNCKFNTTGHNAIAIQDGTKSPFSHGKVVITGNTFTNIGDRIIRFNNVGADTQITIQNNTATNSGNSSNEVIKATTLAEGITYNISSNNWGDNKIVVNEQLKDKIA